MQIQPQEVKSKRLIGKLGTNPVFEVNLIGGLTMILSPIKGVLETLAVGSHRAISRHIAKARSPKIEWTDLAKSEELDPRYFEQNLPYWESYTNQVRARQGLK